MAPPCPRAYKNPYVCSAMWNVEHSLAMVLLNIYKPMQNEWETQSLVEKNRFEIKNETEDQSQSIPKSTGTLTVPRCIFGQNLEILTWIGAD